MATAQFKKFSWGYVTPSGKGYIERVVHESATGYGEKAGDVMWYVGPVGHTDDGTSYWGPPDGTYDTLRAAKVVAIASY